MNSTTGTNATASKNTVTSVGATTLTLGGSGTYSYGDSTAANSGQITGAISLVKAGSGTQTFGEANTYTGGTTISGGRLIAAHSGAFGSGDVILDGGILDLNGASSLALTLGANFTMNSGTLNMTIGGILDFDVIQNGASAQFNGGTIDLTGSTLAVGDYALFSGFSSVSGSLNVTGYDTGAYSASFTNGMLSITAVPEPGTTALGVISLLGAILVFRRKFSRE